MSGDAWLLASVLAPLLGAVVALAAGRRGAAAVGLVSALLTAITAGLLAWEVATGGALRYAVGGWGAPLGIELRVDGFSAAMVAFTGMVGAGVCAYAAAYFSRDGGHHHDAQHQWLFWPLWLLCWCGLNASYVAADLFHLYVTLELQSLAAVSLIALAGGAATAAALRYLMLALTGSLLFVVGVELLYASHATLDITQLAQRVERGITAWLAAALMIAGLLVKAALFPLHFWLPPAHGGAPAPVSAALSALVVKAGFYLVARLWLDLFGGVTPAQVAVLLGALGAAAVLWGGVLALQQQRLKPLIAYSTVAQIGYLFMLFPLADNPQALTAVVVLAASHAAAKAALFMCAGSLQSAYGHDRLDGLDGFGARLPLTVLAFALASMSLIGLPPSGGFTGKWLLVQASMGSGQWWWALAIVAGGLLSAAYLFRVLARAFREPAASAPRVTDQRVMQGSSLALALLAIGLVAVTPWGMALLSQEAP